MPRPFEDRLDASEDFPYDEVDRRLGGTQAPEEIDADRMLEHPALQSFVAEAIRRTINLIRVDSFPRLQADCIVIAIGGELREDGTTLSMTEVARDWGITKAAVSKRVARIRANLHLPTNRNLKSDESRKRYAVTNSSPLNLRARLPGRSGGAAQRP
jgi:hypothetical protein